MTLSHESGAPRDGSAGRRSRVRLAVSHGEYTSGLRHPAGTALGATIGNRKLGAAKMTASARYWDLVERTSHRVPCGAMETIGSFARIWAVSFVARRLATHALPSGHVSGPSSSDGRDEK